MTIYGVDFTSAPSCRKPITAAAASLARGELRVTGVQALESWADFEAFLRRPAPWVAGFDFPFSQPRRLITALGWPSTWSGVTRVASRLGPRGLAEILSRYREGRAPGDRHHFRLTDRDAGACSPMMWTRVPVARMWHAGAPRLAAAGLSILPCRPNRDRRLAFEAYPALAVRTLVGRVRYKAEGTAGRDPALLRARETIVRALVSREAAATHGFHVRLARGLRPALVADPAGDWLDAVLCAGQAAWAWTQRRAGWGIPPDADPLEGWIVGPPIGPPARA